MKFLCVPCDEALEVMESGTPDEAGSMTVIFRCPRCGHATAMLTNAAETQLVHSLGVQIGRPTAAPAPGPMAHLRERLAQTREDAFQPGEDEEPVWTPEALERLNAAPRFVQPMIRQAYSDYARQHGIRKITPEVMDAARQALGMG